MAAITVRWKIPTLDSNVSYGINVYRSVGGENSDYSLLGTTSGNTTKTYTDPNGDLGFFYYVRYQPSGGSEGDRVLAVLEATVTEQRLSEQIYGKMPEILKARVDTDLIDVRKAMANALAMINAYSPVTNYNVNALPSRFEAGIVLLSLVLLFMEHQLQVSIRDYSYSGTGISLQVDRNSKFAATLQTLQKSVNDYMLFVKHGDWPVSPLGLGSEAINVPMARQFGFLFDR
jgi:hypothetical protein